MVLNMTEFYEKRDRYSTNHVSESSKTIDDFLKNNILGADLTTFLEEEFGLVPEVICNQFAQKHPWTLDYSYFGHSVCTIYPEGKHFIVLFVVDQKEGKVISALKSALTPYVRALFADTYASPMGRCLLIQVTSKRTLADVKKLARINMRPKINIKDTSHRFYGILPESFSAIPEHDKMRFRIACAL